MGKRNIVEPQTALSRCNFRKSTYRKSWLTPEHTAGRYSHSLESSHFSSDEFPHSDLLCHAKPFEELDTMFSRMIAPLRAAVVARAPVVRVAVRSMSNFHPIAMVRDHLCALPDKASSVPSTAQKCKSALSLAPFCIFPPRGALVSYFSSK